MRKSILGLTIAAICIGAMAPVGAQAASYKKCGQQLSETSPASPVFTDVSAIGVSCKTAKKFVVKYLNPDPKLGGMRAPASWKRHKHGSTVTWTSKKRKIRAILRPTVIND